MIRILLIVVGTLALALAILGLFLPLLPTTPFLLLASACYVRSSSRLHNSLISNRYVGPHLSNIQSGRGMPLRAKVTALIFLWLSLAYSAWLVPITWLRLCLLIPGIGVSIYLLKMKTLRADTAADPSDAVKSAKIHKSS